jgi:hypothetical protein
MDNSNNKKPNLIALEFDRKKAQKESANAMVVELLEKLAERARKGEIESFIIALRTFPDGAESMLGGDLEDFDFVGYIGMLEILKQRLLDITSDMTEYYPLDEDEGEGSEDED